MLKEGRESGVFASPLKFFSSEVQNVMIILFLQWPLDGRSKNLIGASQEGKQSMGWTKFLASTQEHWFIISQCIDKAIPNCF